LISVCGESPSLITRKKEGKMGSSNRKHNGYENKYNSKKLKKKSLKGMQRFYFLHFDGIDFFFFSFSSPSSALYNYLSWQPGDSHP
jgi:hypothetical protein